MIIYLSLTSDSKELPYYILQEGVKDRSGKPGAEGEDLQRRA